MLNNDALQQLKQLKHNIDSQKDRQHGFIRATQARHGFFVNDAGKQTFVPPDEMLRVFPGDQVTVIIEKDKKGKKVATIEKLKQSDLGEFCGTVVQKGNNYFVEPDLPRFNRWLFIPPKQSKGLTAGTLVRAKIAKHPFVAGKPQVAIKQIIGKPSQNFIEAQYACQKFGLVDSWSADSVSQCNGELVDAYAEQREDLTGLDFFTIDNESSLDLDDAICLRQNGEQSEVLVAIADPSAFIPLGSALDKAASDRASSYYLPGKTINMLPELLSQDKLSLLPNQKRAVIVCKMLIDDTGIINDTQFFSATISSKHKLSYQQVNAFLDDNTSINAQVDPQLSQLKEISQCLNSWRQSSALIIENQAEYSFELDEKGKIKDSTIRSASTAGDLVAELMLATNRSVAAFFTEHNTGIFSAHSGFREEARETIDKILQEQLAEMTSGLDIYSLAGYRNTIKAASRYKGKHPLISILNRLLEKSKFTDQAQPHCGLGFKAYASFTSPLRKYQDFINHHLMHAILAEQPKPDLSKVNWDNISQLQRDGKAAARMAEHWLRCQHAGKLDQSTVYKGQVFGINSSGLHVRLKDSGVEGFVDLRKLPQKFSFDQTYLCLKGKPEYYALEQSVKVKISQVEINKRNVLLEIASPSDT